MVSEWPDGLPARGDAGTTRLEPQRFCGGRQTGANLFAGNEFCESAAQPANSDLILEVFVLLEALGRCHYCQISGQGKLGRRRAIVRQTVLSKANLARCWQSSAHWAQR